MERGWYLTRPSFAELYLDTNNFQNSDAGAEKSLTGKSTVQIPSNVTRLIRGLTHTSSTGVTQIAYYQRGIGSDGDLTNKIVGGATGEDITEKIREAYGFVCNNFYPYNQVDMTDSTKPWDDIILLGFSRGAFTARAISSLIHDVGLLTKEGLEFFFGIIEDWKNQNVPGMEWKWYQAKFGKIDRKTFGWTQYKDTLVKSKLTRTGMSIRAVGVFDTVGALGIPSGIWDDGVREYSFVNTKVSQSIEYAFHALALDEHRTLFTPTVWEHPDAPYKLKQLKQCWFAGVHSNVGGGYSDAGTSNITLAWMISQLEQNKILEFDSHYKDFLVDLNKEFYDRVPKPRPWALGRVYDSTAGLVGALESSIKPPKIRTPGNYHRIDAATGKETKVPLEKTGECMHRSVRVRVEQGGLGMEDDPTSVTTLDKIGNGIEKILGKKPPVETYTKQVLQGDLAPLKGFALTPPSVSSPQSSDISALGGSGYSWKFGERNLPEDEFLDTERKLLLKHRTFA